MTEIAIQMNITRESAGVSWITTVPQKATPEEINEVSDKIMAAIDRQEVWARAARLNDEIETHTKQAAQIKYSVAAFEERHGDFSKANKDTLNAYHQSKEGLLRIKLLIDSLAAEQYRLRSSLAPHENS